jgi:hypothetical protein
VLSDFCIMTAYFILYDTYHADADAVSRVTPKEFEETYIRVYCRHKHQNETVRDVFQQVSTGRYGDVYVLQHCRAAWVRAALFWDQQPLLWGILPVWYISHAVLYSYTKSFFPSCSTAVVPDAPRVAADHPHEASPRL